MHIFRYVVQTPGVAPLAGFDVKEKAEAFVKATEFTPDYNMNLVIVDQYEQIEQGRAQQQKAHAIVTAVSTLLDAAKGGI